MIANAGVFGSTPFLDLAVEEFDRILRVNVRGAMLCIQHAARQMVKQGRGGRIIGMCRSLVDSTVSMDADSCHRSLVLGRQTG